MSLFVFDIVINMRSSLWLILQKSEDSKVDLHLFLHLDCLVHKGIRNDFIYLGDIGTLIQKLENYSVRADFFFTWKV